MRKANPSAIADLPTPGSPIKSGLFFFLRLKICETRSISFSLPTTGSNLSCAASAVMSFPKLSKTGVFDFLDFAGSADGTKGFCFSWPSSSSFSSGKDDPIRRDSRNHW